jgi:hypothetical protein
MKKLAAMKYAVLLLVITMCSCTKEECTHYSAHWKNNSSHQIKVVGYSKGAIVARDMISLGPGEEFGIAEGTMRGKNT